MTWQTQMQYLPDIVIFLVFGLSVYTERNFKSYKSLEAH